MSFNNLIDEKAIFFQNTDHDDLKQDLGSHQNELLDKHDNKLTHQIDIQGTSNQTEDIELDEQIIQECQSITNSIDIFGSLFSKRDLEISEKVSLFKFEIIEDFFKLEPYQLLKLYIKCIKIAVVIFFACESTKTFLIYWKSKDTEKFLTLKSYDMGIMKSSRFLYEFIAKFLTKSLRNNHLGIRKLDNIHNTTEFELHFLADHREYNILLVAAEMGDVNVVEILLKLSIETESVFKDINAQSLAYNGKHFHVLLLLLHKNLTYPIEMDITKCNEEIQNFVGMCNMLNEFIKENNLDMVMEIVQNNPHLRYFYNEQNESAAATSLKYKHTEIYEFLIKNEVYFGPHEKPEAIMEALDYSTQRKVREIHYRLSKDMYDSHISILLGNSSIGYDVPDPKEKFEHVQNAFNILNTIPLIRIILMIVAVSKKFKIIFDFNRDTVQVVDPTSSAYTNGLFYISGRIYIGAKQLLEEATRNQTLGTLAHELCHYALNLTFGNDAKPYTDKDHHSKKKFDIISKHCEENRDKEEIVDMVYDCYPKNMYHAELAVRVPHLLGLYYGEPEKLHQARTCFDELFEFVEENIASKMIEAIPKIKSKVDNESRKKDKKIFRLRRNLYISILLGIIICIYGGYYIYMLPKSFNNLSFKNQEKIRNANVLYQNISLSVKDLFTDNSKAYQQISDDHILLLLDDKTVNFDELQWAYLVKLIIFKWENLANILKQKVLNSALNFQGHIIKYSDVSEKFPTALNFMTSPQIKEVLSGEILKINEKITTNVDFFVERTFVPEDANMIWFEYKYGYDYDLINSKLKQSNESFQEFYEKFLNLNYNARLDIFDKIGENLYFKKLIIDPNLEDFNFLRQTSDNLIEQAEKEKFLILSSEPRTGKTTDFKHLAIRIKSKFPTRFVSFINLRDHTKLYRTNGLVENVEKILQDILIMSSRSKFEQEIFSESFKSGNIVLIWNGFNEIFPTYNDFILNLFKRLHESTKSIQFVCTRPMHSKRLSTAFQIRSWEMITFNDDERREFIIKTLIYQNVPGDTIDKVQKIIKFIKNVEENTNIPYNLNSPLMLKLIIEIFDEKNSSIVPNLFQIIKLFVDNKLQNLSERSQEMNIRDYVNPIYQKYALLTILNIFSSTTLGLKLKRLQIMQHSGDLSAPEIVAARLLYINNEGKFEFAHVTFSDFFVAQYFIDNIYDSDDSMDVNEAELRLEIFFGLTKSYGYQQQTITDFMSSYIDMQLLNDQKKFSAKISQLLRTKFRNFFFRMLDSNYPEVINFLFKFFKKDREVLIELLHVHQEKTFYTAAYDPNNFGIYQNPDKLKSLAQTYLNEEEFRNFMSGKNQRGAILFGTNFYRHIHVPKPSAHHDNEFKSFHGELFWDFFNQTEGNLTIDEQKELFVTALNPKIYMFYEKDFSSDDFFDYEKLWSRYEHLLSQSEMKDVLGDALIKYLEINPVDKANHELFLSLLLKKAETFLSNSQIYEIFLTKNIIHESFSSNYKTMWNFLSSRSNVSERRKILQQDDIDGENLYFHTQIDEKKKRFSYYNYYYYYYDYTPFKIFHKSIISSSTPDLDFINKVYHENFNETEIRDIVLSSNNFIPYVITKLNEESCKEFISFMENIFNRNEKLWIDYLEQKFNTSNSTVFQFIESFRDLPSSETKWFNNLRIFSDSFNKLKLRIN